MNNDYCLLMLENYTPSLALIYWLYFQCNPYRIRRVVTLDTGLLNPPLSTTKTSTLYKYNIFDLLTAHCAWYMIQQHQCIYCLTYVWNQTKVFAILHVATRDRFCLCLHHILRIIIFTALQLNYGILAAPNCVKVYAVATNHISFCLVWFRYYLIQCNDTEIYSFH